MTTEPIVDDRTAVNALADAIGHGYTVTLTPCPQPDQSMHITLQHGPLSAGASIGYSKYGDVSEVQFNLVIKALRHELGA